MNTVMPNHAIFIESFHVKFNLQYNGDLCMSIGMCQIRIPVSGSNSYPVKFYRIFPE